MIESHKTYDFDPRNLPNDVHEAIGLAVASSAQTEGMIDAAISTILGVNERIGRSLTAQHGLPGRVSMLRSLAHEANLPEDLHSALEFAIKQIESAVELRNAVVHRTYFRDPDTGQVFAWKVTAKKQLKSDVVPVIVEPIRQDAAKILGAGMDLADVLEAIDILRKKA